VDVALGQAVSNVPDLPVVAALMRFPNFADEDVQLAHFLARPFRHQLMYGREILRALEAIDMAMGSRKLRPLATGFRRR
jgi:hypothetical protein